MSGRVTHPYVLLQESHAAQLQILMEFLKVARRNKREVTCFVFRWVRSFLLFASSLLLFNVLAWPYLCEGRGKGCLGKSRAERKGKLISLRVMVLVFNHLSFRLTLVNHVGS